MALVRFTQQILSSAAPISPGRIRGYRLLASITCLSLRIVVRRCGDGPG